MKIQRANLPVIGLYLLLTILAMSATGCSSFGRKMKAFLNGNAEPAVAAAPPKERTFGENPDLAPPVPRRYKRVTKQSLEASSQLDANAGSLWVNEGQGAYLFSQNIMRMLGDPLTVKIDGDPKDQLSAKVETIKKLLDKIESRKAALRAPAAEGGAKTADGEGQEGEAAPKPTPAPKPEAPSKTADFPVKNVPTRIVERLVDGNYRVKGSQPLMVGSREYKVIVTGIVRAEDFSDEGISAAQLIDPKFDIVSPRRKELE